MITNITLVKLGRSVQNRAWWVDNSKAVHRLYFVNNGSAVVRYAQKDYRLNKGKIYLLPRSESFTVVEAEGFDHTFFDFYCVPAFRLDSFVETDPSDFGLEKMFDFLNALLEKDPPDNMTACFFLEGILSLIGQKTKLPYIHNEFIVRALDIIHKDPAGITTESLSKAVGLDKSYFIRLFSQYVGTTPMKYIRSIRLAQGANLVKSGVGICAAAEKCGFSSETGFWKAIKREYGCSPSDFLKASSDIHNKNGE